MCVCTFIALQAIKGGTYPCNWLCLPPSRTSITCVLILMKSKNIMPHISSVAFPLESKATRHITLSLCCVVFSSTAMFDSLGLHGLQHARPPCLSLSSKVCPSSCPLHQWYHPAISSSDALFCSQSFPASGTFPVSWLFASGGQNTGASSSASVLPISIQGWFPLIDWFYLLAVQGVFS